MKRLAFVLISIVGILLSCVNKEKPIKYENDANSSDSLILKKSVNKNFGDSSGVSVSISNERPTHAAHYSANLPHNHNGEYHNGNY